MANFISIATTITGTPTLQLNTSAITHVAYVSATSVVLYLGTKTITLTVAGATTTNFYNAILTALVSTNGPILVPVVLPTGVTVTAAVIA
jgi:hypothetical protein